MSGLSIGARVLTLQRPEWKVHDGAAVQSACREVSAHLRDAEGNGFLIRSAVSARCLTPADDAAVVVSSCGPAWSRRWAARLLGSTEKG